MLSHEEIRDTWLAYVQGAEDTVGDFAMITFPVHRLRDLLNHITELETILHDLRQDSTAYQRGWREGQEALREPYWHTASPPVKHA